MIADERERERDEEEQEVLISDKRHSRKLESTAEPEPEASVAQEDPPADAVPAPEPGEVVEFEPPPRDESAAAEQPADEAEPDSPEAASMRMLFEAGITPYLHGQLQLLLSFALIYLGRQPNPATGLVSTDLEQARLVIDLFLFIVDRTGKQMPPEDQQNLVSVASSLKMEYAQAAQNAPGPAPGGTGEAES